MQSEGAGVQALPLGELCQLWARWRPGLWAPPAMSLPAGSARPQVITIGKGGSVTFVGSPGPSPAHASSQVWQPVRLRAGPLGKVPSLAPPHLPASAICCISCWLHQQSTSWLGPSPTPPCLPLWDEPHHFPDILASYVVSLTQDTAFDHQCWLHPWCSEAPFLLI